MRGRGFAVTGFVLGISASIASNVFHSYLTSTGSTLTLVGSLVISAFWPLALYICLECMARVAWPPGVWFWLARYLGLSIVAGIAAYVSWQHMHGLLKIFKEETIITYIGPGAVDGLMLLCSAALIALNTSPGLVAREIKTEDRPKPVSDDQIAAPIPEAQPNYIPAIQLDEAAVQKQPESIQLPDQLAADDLRDVTKVITRGGDELKAKAIQWVQDYTGTKTLTGQLVGGQFGRSPTWGRAVLRAAKGIPRAVEPPVDSSEGQTPSLSRTGAANASVAGS
jgi:hypothetical protein